MKQQQHIQRLNRGISITFIILLLLALIFCYYGYPLFTGDSECFLPTTFAIKKGMGLYNPFYDAGFIADRKFSFYPPVFPLSVAGFMYNCTALALYCSVTFINMLSIACSFIILKHVVKKYQAHFAGVGAPVVFSVLWMFANCTFILTGNARPEVLARLLLYILILLVLYRGKFNYFLAGCVIAVACITSPAFGIYMLLIAGQYLLFNNSFKPVLPALGGGVLVLLLFLGLYPYPISKLINDMHLHSQHVAFISNFGFTIPRFITYHVAAYNASFGILLFIAALVLYLKKIGQLPGRINRFLTAGLLAAHLLLILYITVRNIPMAYYMYVLSPLMLLLVAESYFTSAPGKLVNWQSVLVLLVSFSFLRLVAVFFVNCGQRDFLLTGVQEKMATYASMKDKRIGVTSSMWVFFGENVACKPDIYRGTNAGAFDYLIVQQYASGLAKPAAIEGFEIIEDHFKSSSSFPDRITGTRYPPFYQYAVYKRK